MKFNVEVEIDWIEEDGTLSDELNHRLQEKIVEAAVGKLFADASNSISETVIEKVNAAVDDKINSFINDFMNKEFDRTDRWGDVIAKGITPKNLLKEKLDEFLTAKVNKNGQVSSYSYDNETDRLSYILSKTAQEHISKYQQGISDDILRKIKEDINEETRKKVVDSILSDYSLKKLINPLG
ncbi:hypothetical protein [Enterococcus larvae]|uniref:hypothetical protein n=1 Tax=Enterococcus larvae TaxID=2794352 RepID=UPI003F2AF9C6